MKRHVSLLVALCLLLLCTVVDAGQDRDRRDWRDDDDDDRDRDDCPVGIEYCDNPRILLDDPTIACDMDTCAWLVTWLDPNQKPAPCRSFDVLDDSNLPDLLEPCYWWEHLYGRLQTTARPTTSAFPTKSPSSYPTSSPAPTLRPSLAATGRPSSLRPTFSSTEIATTAPSTAKKGRPPVAPTFSPSISAVPSELPSVVPSEEPSVEPTRVVDVVREEPFGSVLVNYLLRRKRRDRRLQQQQQQLDPVALLDLTRAHLRSELQTSLGRPEWVRDVRLVITHVQHEALANGTLVDTKALDGSIVVSQVYPDMKPRVTQQLVQAAFAGEAKERYLALLQRNQDPTLRRVVGLYVGRSDDSSFFGPNGDEDEDENGQDPIVPRVSDPKNTTETESGDWKDTLTTKWNDWWEAHEQDRVLWIAVFAGGGAALLGLCLIACLLLRRRRVPDLDLKPADTASTTSPVSKGNIPEEDKDLDEEELVMTQQAVSEPNLSRSRGGTSDVESDLGYQSEVTSVYSYIDTNLDDDQSAMAGTAFMYGVDDNRSVSTDMYKTNLPGDEDDQSRLWSVAASGDDVEQPPPRSNSPSRMVVSAEKNKDDCYIFTDNENDEEDDDLSVVSERWSSPPKDPDMPIAETSAMDPQSSIVEPDEQEEESHKYLNVQAKPGAKKKKESPRDTLMDPQIWSFVSPASPDHSGGSPESNTSGMPRCPLGLSRLSSQQGSPSSSMPSHFPDDEHSIASSVDSSVVTVSATDHLPATHLKENNDSVNRRLLVSDSASASSGDDNDSLFTPRYLANSSSAKKKQPSANEPSKAETSQNLARGRGSDYDFRILNDSDKAKLGLSFTGREHLVDADDYEEDDEAYEKSLQLPMNYSVGEEKKDDMSMCSAASSNGYAGDMASF